MIDKNTNLVFDAIDADDTDKNGDDGSVPAFKVYFYKPQGRPAYVCSSRVLRWADRRGFTSIINYRSKAGEYKATIDGPATAKKIAAAFQQVHAALIAGGHVAADSCLPGGDA